jgi:S-formylglutathione hydrolase FrmB
VPIHNFTPQEGRIEWLRVPSAALAENLLGDPTTRTVAVYVPAGYDDAPDRDYPLFVDLAGFTGSGLKHLSWKAFGETVPQRLDRLVATGAMGPVLCAFPDCFTSLGGNQYINSAAMGRWEDFLCGDLVTTLEERYRVRPDARAVFGKSSGGYGAIVHGLKHGDTWNAVACHSGDMAFELAYLSDMPRTLDALATAGGIEAFLQKMERANKVRGADLHVLMMLAMAATYDPDPTAPKGIRLPVDLQTCQVDPERWRAWLAHDPLVLAEQPECQDSLKRLKGIFIDCGSTDQYHLHYGARALAAKLEALGIEHVYQEFDDNHSDIDYRMDVSLPWLYDALS